MVLGARHRLPQHGCLGKWLKTPLGWARAQLIYEKLDRVPPFNSLLEVVCLLVQKYYEQRELLGARAQAQAALGGEAAEKAWKDFSGFVNRVAEEDATDKMRKRLEELKKIKEIRIRPLVTTRRALNVPTYSGDSVRKSGVLDQQIRLVKHRRPRRARAGRKRR